MTKVKTEDSFLRRNQDFPVLLLSQDYELFFNQSGSSDKCLFEPTDLLLDFADRHGLKITFFVDAGMMCRMDQLQQSVPSLAKELSAIKRHIESIHRRGHEIGLHIHPHWEDTRWRNDAWDFNGTRYQLREFSSNEVSGIVTKYTSVLNNLCDGSVSVYRAGGFCVEPFRLIKDDLLKNGISIDSSIVPGLKIDDSEKGVDFRSAPKSSWWHFDDSPLEPKETGAFLEISITPIVLPIYHYWQRGIDRLLQRQATGVIGDGVSKSLGKSEVARRLLGSGRISELSLDAAKVSLLLSINGHYRKKNVWQVMGHPKLLGTKSLEVLENFISSRKFNRFETLADFGRAIRAHEPFQRVD